MKSSSVIAKHTFFQGSAIIILPMLEVPEKIKDGYQYVNFSAIDEDKVLKGKVMKAIIRKNYYSELKLDGGQLTSKRFCKDDSCNKKMIKVELVADKDISDMLAHQPQYAILEGKCNC